uniref:Uncharacterized protein n=1 Tax=Magnetococcus massalia (strain MO-1) TaxID=451514 RepID=A0A1S7LJT9_MAGMO|nr:protein of unknown function [Candidatus Magnetococcus massalia]
MWSWFRPLCRYLHAQNNMGNNSIFLIYQLVLQTGAAIDSSSMNQSCSGGLSAIITSVHFNSSA